MQFFRMDVISAEGIPIHEQELAGCLTYIADRCKDKTGQTNECAVGLLTAMNRNGWSDAYEALKDENSASLREIETALFLVCLDGDSTAFKPDDLESRAAAQAIHGNGLEHNAANRWFDKTMQVDTKYDCRRRR